MRLSVSLPTTNTLAFPTAGSFAVAKPIPEELFFRSRSYRRHRRRTRALMAAGRELAARGRSGLGEAQGFQR